MSNYGLSREASLQHPSSPRPPTYIAGCRRICVHQYNKREEYSTTARSRTYVHPNADLPARPSLRRIVVHVVSRFQRIVVIFCCLLLSFEFMSQHLHATCCFRSCLLSCCDQLNFDTPRLPHADHHGASWHPCGRWRCNRGPASAGSGGGDDVIEWGCLTSTCRRTSSTMRRWR